MKHKQQKSKHGFWKEEKENTTPKAILPKLAADSEAIINFSTDAITVGEKHIRQMHFAVVLPV